IPETETAKFRREHLGFIFQEYNLLNTLTIYENIALALTMREAAEEKIDERIRELAEKLDISSVLSKFPYEVSGGQRQRCACARAVIVEPDIILADEPTGALDSVAARQLLNIFMMLCREYGVTILMVTHDVLSASYCDRILFMRDGEIRTSLERGQSDRSSFFAGILEKTASLENEIEKERPHARQKRS
ncbi:MAG: ATP-binding cassette domain-containing protein, partial [Lachnospiraceae bacterium]|nr:ATP-binding cassette domain-containing protein [Lachnospiraceae bacterium]